MSASRVSHPGPRPAGPLPPDSLFHAVENAVRYGEPRTRLYRVRPSRDEDHPLLASGEATASLMVTIVRIDGQKMIFSAAYPWEDTDNWAGWRWRKAEHEFGQWKRGVRE